MPVDDIEWSVEFARDTVRDSLAAIIDEATPGLISRLANDPKAYLQLLAVTKLVSDEATELLQETATSARHAGLNWERIGSALEMSRQEAQQRFGADTHDRTMLVPVVSHLDAVAGHLPLGTRVTIPLSADEMAGLALAGNYGWHGVAFSSTTWTLEFDEQQWEHATTMRKKPPEGEGWQPIGRYFHRYWKRPTGLPILPGSPNPSTFAYG
ncbi:MAG: hypothetical protein FWD83_03685 [Promicromonosporaceae bacterium]|nr:hypothetical protein [Promicromonosporaceae bacterium]